MRQEGELDPESPRKGAQLARPQIKNNCSHVLEFQPQTALCPQSPMWCPSGSSSCTASTS